MTNNILSSILNYIINNDFFVNLQTKKILNNEITNNDFENLNFENIELLKNIFFSKKTFFYKEYNEKSIQYHSFSWLVAAKKIGGYDAIGPLLQGFKKPIHDLSRGCSVKDIVNVSLIGAYQGVMDANI